MFILRTFQVFNNTIKLLKQMFDLTRIGLLAINLGMKMRDLKKDWGFRKLKA